MLDKLKAADFKKAIGKTGSIVIEDGPDSEVTFYSVSEHPKAARPDAKKGERTPFTVLMRCDCVSAPIESKQYSILLPDGTRLEEVFLNEISSHPDPEGPVDETLCGDTRFYQICFG